MTDHFLTLGLPRDPHLDADLIRERFHLLSRKIHPDSGNESADPAAFEHLNAAQATLTNPAFRLRHLHELEFGEVDRGGAISGPLMDLFSEVGAAVQAAKTIAGKKENAQSALAKALLEGEVPKAHEAISAAQGKVSRASEAALESVPSERYEAGDLASAYRELAFLSRWREQLQAAFASLF